DERLHLPPERLRDEVLRIAELSSLTCARLSLVVTSQTAELEPEQRCLGAEKRVLLRRLQPLAGDVQVVARGLAVARDYRDRCQRVPAPLASLLPEELARLLRGDPRLAETVEHGEEFRTAKACPRLPRVSQRGVERT